MFNKLLKRNSRNENLPSADKYSELSPDEQYRQYGALIQAHLRSGNYAGYRNDMYASSEILKKEGKYADQLRNLLVVFYLDLSGFSSVQEAIIICKGSLAPTPPFIAPSVAKNIKTASTKCQFDNDQVLSFYRSFISESMVPVHLFTLSETETILRKLLTDGCDAATKAIPKRKTFKIVRL